MFDYPNKEVAQSFSEYILSESTLEQLEVTDNLLHKIRRSFLANEINKFIEYINILFKNIPYLLVDEKEKYYHSLFYIIMRIMGYQIEAEVLTIEGRIDAVVKTDDDIYEISLKTKFLEISC